MCDKAVQCKTNQLGEFLLDWPQIFSTNACNILLIEMVDEMKKVAKQDVELTAEERNLLSVAYKNVIGAQRE